MDCLYSGLYLITYCSLNIAFIHNTGRNNWVHLGGLTAGQAGCVLLSLLGSQRGRGSGLGFYKLGSKMGNHSLFGSGFVRGRYVSSRLFR